MRIYIQIQRSKWFGIKPTTTTTSDCLFSSSPLLYSSCKIYKTKHLYIFILQMQRLDFKDSVWKLNNYFTQSISRYIYKAIHTTTCIKTKTTPKRCKIKQEKMRIWDKLVFITYQLNSNFFSRLDITPLTTKSKINVSLLFKEKKKRVNYYCEGISKSYTYINFTEGTTTDLPTQLEFAADDMLHSSLFRLSRVEWDPKNTDFLRRLFEDK